MSGGRAAISARASCRLWAFCTVKPSRLTSSASPAWNPRSSSTINARGAGVKRGPGGEAAGASLDRGAGDCTGYKERPGGSAGSETRGRFAMFHPRSAGGTELAHVADAGSRERQPPRGRNALDDLRNPVGDVAPGDGELLYDGGVSPYPSLPGGRGGADQRDSRSSS